MWAALSISNKKSSNASVHVSQRHVNINAYLFHSTHPFSVWLGPFYWEVGSSFSPQVWAGTCDHPERCRLTDSDDTWFPMLSYRECEVIGFPSGSVVKNLSANAGDIRDVDSNPGWGRSSAVGKGIPLQSSCLETPWMEMPGGLQSMASQRVGHGWETEHTR